MNARTPLAAPVAGLPRPARPSLCVVVPVHNEIDVLPLFLERLGAVLTVLPVVPEILFVDDGSRDGSAAWIERAAVTDSRIGLLQLSRNFGKEAAMTAGLDHAEAEVVVVMDADLQDPPEELSRMLDAWFQGNDVIVMKRRSRNGDGSGKRIAAAVYYRLLARVGEIPIPVDVGDFRLMSRRAVLALRSLPERNRYMKGLFAWIGMPQVQLEFERPARAAGNTRWPLMKLIGLAADGLTSFSVLPLRFAGIAGMLAACFALVMALVYAGKTVLFGDSVDGFPTLIVSIFFIGGLQLCGLGILGEYVGRIYTEVKQRPLYLRQSYRPARQQSDRLERQSV
ncbi:MAG: glycosyltransferase family 2 protein [Pseudomonadota bacterium]|nr:glycosyltransferase family 2 protein [Pseudomonadota bacterium]